MRWPNAVRRSNEICKATLDPVWHSSVSHRIDEWVSAILVNLLHLVDFWDKREVADYRALLIYNRAGSLERSATAASETLVKRRSNSVSWFINP